MNGISGNFPNPELDAKTRFAPKLKPEINRVSGNPFYPNGYVGTPSVETNPEETVNPGTYAKSESQRQVFEANLPVTQQEQTQKVGTMLNTVA